MTPTSAPVATPTPVPPRAPIETVVLPPPRGEAPWWPWFAGAAGLLTLGVALWLLRRPDSAALEEPASALDYAPGPAPIPSPVPRLALALRPIRAGLNLISATADCEVTIANQGDLPAEDVRADLALFSAREAASDELAAFFAAPVGRPAVASFTLAPGEERRFRAVAALPHDGIHALDARGRPMFVPLVAVTAWYRADGEERRAGRAFVLGVERVDAVKLAPMWLDTPPRQYDSVAARPHGELVEG